MDLWTQQRKEWLKVSQSCLTLWDSMDCSLPGSSVHGIFQARVLEWVAIPFSRGSFRPRDWTQVSCIAGDSLPADPAGKPKNTGVGSLSLLHRIFPTQGSKPGLPHWRQILYHLRHQRSPRILEWEAYPFCRVSFQPRIEQGSPTLQVDSLPLSNRESQDTW